MSINSIKNCQNVLKICPWDGPILVSGENYSIIFHRVTTKRKKKLENNEIVLPVSKIKKKTQMHTLDWKKRKILKTGAGCLVEKQSTERRREIKETFF